MSKRNQAGRIDEDGEIYCEATLFRALRKIKAAALIGRYHTEVVAALCGPRVDDVGDARRMHPAEKETKTR